MFAFVGDQKLFYRVTGKGSPLIVVHGGLGLDHRYLFHWFKPLAENHQLIFIDLPGCGRSGVITNRRRFSLEWVVDVIEQFREEMIGESASVIGHSLGGILAALHAVRYPKSIKRLITINTPFFLDCRDEAAIATMQNELYHRYRGTIPFARLRTNNDFKQFMEVMAPTYFANPHYVGSFMKHNKTRYSLTTFEMARAQFAVKIERYQGLFTKISQPALWVHGTRDSVVTPTASRRMQKRVAGSKGSYFSNSGHYPFVEEPERFVKVVDHFLRG